MTEEQNAEQMEMDMDKVEEMDEVEEIKLRGKLVFSDSDNLEARFSKAPAESNKVRKNRDKAGFGNFIRNDRRLHICKSLFPPDYDVETHEVTGSYAYTIKIRKRSEDELKAIYEGE